MEKKQSIVFKAGRYVTSLLINSLPRDMLFHNLHHTTNVVRGVRDITNHLDITKKQQEILLLAAWFHDTGFIHTYQGHEAESEKLAKAFLSKVNYDSEKLESVLNCIRSTQMPQQPSNILEQVICDADMYHLSLPEYCHLHKLLREEWRINMHKEWTDQEWIQENLAFLREHHYWTTYGQELLQKHKILNIEKCQELLEEAIID